MSGTKLHSRKAPAIDAEQPRALIVAHGQPSDPHPAEAALSDLTARVQARLPDTPIASATMANPGELERAIEQLPKAAAIYPLFMADGWFVKTALAERLQGHAFRVLPPLGLDVRLPDLAAGLARKMIDDAGWRPADTHVLLAAHGSMQGDAAARSARDFAHHLATKLPFAGITIGFLEEAPYLASAAVHMPIRSICLPFFAMRGEHVRDDVPEALSRARFTGPVLPPFCQYDGIARLIADTLHCELSERTAA